MKKFLLALAAILMVSGAFAQEHKHAIGLRLGNGAELQYEYHLNSDNFIKANLGLYGFGNSFFVTGTYNWNCFDWNWTPSVGRWFLNAGVGASLGAYAGGFQLGVAGDVAFGIKFKAPISLSLDYRPTIFLLHNSWGHGWGNICLACTYNF